MLTLYEDAFLGGAVADFVDLAMGSSEAGSVSTSWAMVAERLERRGFDVAGASDPGELDLDDAGAAARWLADDASSRPEPPEPRGTSIRIRAECGMASARWARPGDADVDWARFVHAPDRLVVFCATPGETPASPMLPLCAHDGAVWYLAAGAPVAVPDAAIAVAANGATGCTRLRGHLVVEGHPDGAMSAELVIVWLRGS